MNNLKIICALIGLCGAVQNNGKTEDTDDVIKNAIVSDTGDEEIIQMIHNEKYRISPDCETCRYPCGNTSDYDENEYMSSDEKILKLKDDIITELRRIAQNTDGELPHTFMKGIAYLGFDLEEESFKDCLEELKLC